MRSAADCQVDCALVQVVLAGTSPSRSASLGEASFLFLGANYTYRTGSLLEFLVPLLEGHPRLCYDRRIGVYLFVCIGVAWKKSKKPFAGTSKSPRKPTSPCVPISAPRRSE